MALVPVNPKQAVKKPASQQQTNQRITRLGIGKGLGDPCIKH